MRVQVYQFRNMRITVMTLFQMLNTKFDFKVIHLNRNCAAFALAWSVGVILRRKSAPRRRST